MKKQTKLGLVLAAAAVISVSVASLVSARGWVQNGADWYYVDNNNEYVTDTIQSSGNAKFYLGENGAMQRDYFLEDYNENTYYFGQNGAMVTNTWVAIESSRVENQDDYIPDNYWYYFQASGKAMKGSSDSMKKATIDGKKYGFNEYGQMATGWIDAAGKTINPDDETNPFINALYYAGGDNDGVLRTGWVTYYDGYDGNGGEYQSEYTNLYFYFNTSNNKKYGYSAAETKTINGRKYAFNNEGIMLSGWDVFDNRQDLGILTDKTTYFSGQDDGHQVKKGWVYAVPAESINKSNYDDDEEKYMYFASSGDIVKDQFKKINGKFYAFDRTGIMKTGVVIWCSDGVTNTVANYSNYKFVDTLDLDWAEGADVAKKGFLRYDDGSNDHLYVSQDGRVILTNTNKVSLGDYVKLHLFGEDGARKTGINTIEFSDDTYTFSSTASGDKGSGAFSKKYYSLGIQLKASSDIRYGIYNQASPSHAINRYADYNYGEPLYAQYNKAADDMTPYYTNLENGSYIVLTTGGAKQKGNRTAKKDSDGNYWAIDADDSSLKGIFTVNVKTGNSMGNFETKDLRVGTLNHNTDNGKEFTTDKLVDLGLLAESALKEDAIKDAKWKATVWEDGSGYFTLASYVGPVFQSDYRDGSNKWIPFGVLDNSNKTVTFNYTDAVNDGCDKALGYVVKPNNDYFLNCYWTE